jgi:hypothetical protein
MTSEKARLTVFQKTKPFYSLSDATVAPAVALRVGEYVTLVIVGGA